MRRRIRRGAFTVPILWGLVGVGLVGTGGWLHTVPATEPLEDTVSCDGIRQSRRKLRKCLKQRDAMRLTAARRALQSLDSTPTPLERDLLRLRIAANYPRLADSLCVGTETDEGSRLCARITGRPHLYAVDAERVLQDLSSSASDRQPRSEKRRNGPSKDRD